MNLLLNFIINKKRSTLMATIIGVNINKRTMLSSAGRRVYTQSGVTLSREYSTKRGCKITKAAKQLSNDDSGKHTHVYKELCILPDCEKTSCETLCDNSKGFIIWGHNTHKPPAGRFTRFIAPVDVNNKDKNQYFVPTNKKVLHTEEKKEGLKPDEKTSSYIKDHDIKYEP